jgi:glycosyltransferase involved in cell wall biosynthesis
MKIALIGGEPAYMLRFRGHLLAALQRRGHEVLSVCGGDDPESSAGLQALGVRYLSLPLDRAGAHPGRELHTLQRLTAILRREKPDLTLANSLKLIGYSGIASRLAGVPRSAALVTGLGVTFAPPRGPRERALQRVARVLLKLGLEPCDCVVFHNPEDERLVRDLGLLRPTQHSAVVDGSGVDLQHFTASPVPTDPVRFLFMGRVIESKGALDFIEAALLVKAHFAQAQFCLLGWRDPSHPHALPQSALERAAAHGIEVIDHQRDVRPELQRATVLVVPSHHREGLPRSMLEAFACARPVLASDVPGCRHALEPGSGWLVPQQSPAALAQAMRQVCAHPESASQLGPACRALCERRFDVERVTAQILAALSL